ncbi:MAG: SUMF1/EgtB/PvdO family nonheme iron enzyme [Candidatus Hydrogenedentes bacterium]|nr:SUMF1/EgtB/PvdO family nonheme iron enzyme [Candidatus Hydrogenedentota bacterium]
MCFGCGARLVVPAVAASAFEADINYMPGDKVSDRYEIEEAVGRGGMGVVYRAQDLLIKEKVALKFLNPRLLNSQRGQQLFIQEAQVARRLRHENIVAVHDVTATQEGVMYLSMEFLKGHSLRSYLRRHRKERRFVEVRLAVAVVSQVLAALEYAHHMVIHRDMKPENVMLMPGERVKVLDFGLAKAIDEEALIPDTDASGQGRVVGTLAYAAPEQKLHQVIDLRADIYAVGLLFQEMLTLRTPLDEPAEINTVRDDVAPSLLTVLGKALRTQKENRWQSAGEFRRNLLHAFDESYKPVSIHSVGGELGPSVSTEGMVYIEGGSFLIGNNDLPEEAPEHEAYVEPFYMDVSPVTTEQYDVYLKATKSPEPKFWRNAEFNGPKQPVVGVSWAEANAYAVWAGKQLPTEAQWEFAARGKENRKYPWGNLEPDPTRCNYGDYLNMPSIITMHEDGDTPEGIHDLAGNVYEWTQDCFLPYNPSKRGAVITQGSPRRVVRGGSWHSTVAELRCSHRKGLFAESQLTTVGFRCVLPVQPMIKT